MSNNYWFGEYPFSYMNSLDGLLNESDREKIESDLFVDKKKKKSAADKRKEDAAG
jgi:hypothetical protein